MKQRKYTSFEEYLEKSLKNPDFKKVWDDSETEYQLSRQIIKKRLKNKLTQQDLAKKANTTQAIISRIESMNGNPSLHFLKKIATALDAKLSISKGFHSNLTTNLLPKALATFFKKSKLGFTSPISNLDNAD
jgi:transcriptional regulator with XRE-family HTH domain